MYELLQNIYCSLDEIQQTIASPSQCINDKFDHCKLLLTQLEETGTQFNNQHEYYKQLLNEKAVQIEQWKSDYYKLAGGLRAVQAEHTVRSSSEIKNVNLLYRAIKETIVKWKNMLQQSISNQTVMVL